jgi:hypothetical protein
MANSICEGLGQALRDDQRIAGRFEYEDVREATGADS